MTSERPSIYYHPDRVAEMIGGPGGHQEIVGGLWEEMGALQMRALQEHGLRPADRLLDVGCGSLRLGRLAAAWLEPGNYWGTDISPDLMDAGYEREIVPAGLADRLPRAQLVEDADFSFRGLPSGFRWAIAQSVFTHLPIVHLRRCLTNLAGVMAPGGVFLFTIFPAPDDGSESRVHQPGGITTFADRDPFHHSGASVLEAGTGLPWEIAAPRPWNHPRGQYLVRAVRT